MPQSNRTTRPNQGQGDDPEFESRIGVYRRRQRLLVARSIHFQASREEFETACRAKLSNPDSVLFVWQGVNSRYTHRGWVMLGFDTRENCRLAQNELVNFRIRNRNVNISVAGRRASAPANPSTQESSLAQAVAPANPGAAPLPPGTTRTTVTTTITTTSGTTTRITTTEVSATPAADTTNTTAAEEIPIAAAADIMSALLDSLDHPSTPQ